MAKDRRGFATTYTIAANVIDTDMFLLRSVHFAR